MKKYQFQLMHNKKIYTVTTTDDQDKDLNTKDNTNTIGKKYYSSSKEKFVEELFKKYGPLENAEVKADLGSNEYLLQVAGHVNEAKKVYEMINPVVYKWLEENDEETAKKYVEIYRKTYYKSDKENDLQFTRKVQQARKVQLSEIGISIEFDRIKIEERKRTRRI